MKPNSQDRPAADRAAPRGGSGRGRRALCGSLNGRLPAHQKCWIGPTPRSDGLLWGRQGRLLGFYARSLVSLGRLGFISTSGHSTGKMQAGITSGAQQSPPWEGGLRSASTGPRGSCFREGSGEAGPAAGALDPGGARSHSALYQRWAPLARGS